MAHEMVVQVGSKSYGMSFGALPPIGTRFNVHKHLTDDGCYASHEVVAHEWELCEPAGDPSEPQNLNPFFTVRVKTRKV